MVLPNPPEVQKRLNRATKMHAAFNDDELVVCDCRKCEGLNRSYRYRYVKVHRRKNGRTPRDHATERENGQQSTSGNYGPHQRPLRSVSRAPAASSARSRLKPYSRPFSPSPHHSPHPSSSRAPLSPWKNGRPSDALLGHTLSQLDDNHASPPSPAPIPPETPFDDAPSDGSDEDSGPIESDNDYPDLFTPACREVRRLLTLLLSRHPREFLPPEDSLTPSTSRFPTPDVDELDLEDYPWDTADCFWPFPHRSPVPSVGSIVSEPETERSSPMLAPIDPEEDNKFWAELLEDDDPFILHDRAMPDQDHPHFPDDLDNLFTPESSRAPTPEPEPDPDEEEPPFQPFMDENHLDPEPAPEDEPEPDAYPCGAFDDDPSDFRNFFIQTWLQSAFEGATHHSISNMLRTHRDWLLVLHERGQLPPHLHARLPFFPLSLRSLERRLGMDVNSLITVYSLCPKCGLRRTIDFIENTESPECPRIINDDICGGTLYTTSTLYGGKTKRTPTRSYPHISIIDSLERQLLRPGFAEVLQLWRKPGDEEGEFPPSSRPSWVNRTPMGQLFGKPWEGWGWRNIPVGLSRDFDEETGVYGDFCAGETRALVRLPLGLSVSINIDGFTAYKKADYSVQGVYAVVNNLPTELRTSHENMMLACVMPGPKEPSHFEFNQMLEPLVDELHRLGRGVHLAVYCRELNRPEQKLVHGSLSALVIDYISRIKCNGHAGTKSELHFCLYCKTKRCYISVPEGFLRERLQLRDPQECLQDKYNWLQAPDDEKEEMRKRTGMTFTEFDRLPGFYGPSHSPIDGMHLFNLGMDSWIVTSILIKPGMFNARHRHQLPEDTPMGRLKAALSPEESYWPSHCKRIATDPEHFTSSMKAEQWRHFISVAHIYFFKAWKVGGIIPADDIPIGNENTTEFKEQLRQAKLLLEARRRVHRDMGLDDEDLPTLEDCRASRNPRLYYRNILRYLVAMSILLSREITREDVALAQQLLERMAVSFTQMNVHLSPSFHYAMHVEPAVLKYGSLYNFWAYSFERANLQLQTTNSNGHGQGVLEATMARAFLKRTEFYRILERMQDIPRKDTFDTSTIKAILAKLPSGPEHERQRGMLTAVLAGEAPFRVQERTRLPNISAKVNFEGQNRVDYNLIIGFLNSQVPGSNFYGLGRRIPGGIYVHPTDSARSYSHVLQRGTRYGVANHSWGHKSRYGYIYNRTAVIIRQIYQVQVETLDEVAHEFVCVIVQRFIVPDHEADTPWRLWAKRLQTNYWVYNELGPREVVSADALTGVFFLTKVHLSDGCYWVTRAMPNYTLEDID